MRLFSSISLPLRKFRVRLARTPRQAAWLLQRIVCSDAGPWALIDVIWRTIFISLQYDRWLKRNELTATDITELRGLLSDLSYQPLISILMPVYNTDERWLCQALDSVKQQIYPHWELCIADDASTAPHVTSIIQQYQQADSRIKLVRRSAQGHIAAASNSALELATGEYVALLDHDDVIAPDALLEVARLLNQHPEADMIYSDEDKLDTNGHRLEPFFKPDWSPLLLFNINYITHFAVMRRQIVMDVEGFRHAYVGSQDHDLFLRITARTNRVFHIPRVLYSWRKAATSAALSADNKSYAQNASFRAVEDAIALRDSYATVTPGNYAPFIRVRYPVMDDPLVSLVVLVRSEQDLTAAQAMIGRTEGRRCELIVVTRQAHVRHLQPSGSLHCVISNSGSQRGMLQAGARAASGAYLLFADHPIRPVDPDWLTALLEYAQLPYVACVGAKVLSKRHAVMAAGMALGIHKRAEAVGVGIADVPQLIFYLNLKDAIREVSAVSAACMMVKASTFWQLGGFDDHFSDALYDADFCLRAGERSLRTVFTPYARVVTLAGNKANTGSKEELGLFQQRWHEVIASDPYYNPHLTRRRQDMRLRTD